MQNYDVVYILYLSLVHYVVNQSYVYAFCAFVWSFLLN